MGLKIFLEFPVKLDFLWGQENVMDLPAQSGLERAPVNHWVAGSSPAWGASRISQLAPPFSSNPSKIELRRKKGALRISLNTQNHCRSHIACR